MFRNTIRDIAVNLLAAALFALAISEYAHQNHYWNWPNAIVGGLLTFCAVLYILDRIGFGLSDKTRVRNWLDDSGFSVQTIQDEKRFHFVMTDNIQLKVGILQSKAGQPVNIVVPGLLPSPQQLANFKAKTPDQQVAFWRRVRLELIRLGIQYSDLKLEGEGLALNELVALTRSLSQTEFLSRVRFVRGAGRLYREIIADELGTI